MTVEKRDRHRYRGERATSRAWDDPIPPMNRALVRTDDCKHLWCAVLLRAFLDLHELQKENQTIYRSGKSKPPSASHIVAYREQARRTRLSAHDFFFSKRNEGNLRMVCDLAGFDFDLARTRAREMYNCTTDSVLFCVKSH